MGILPYFTSDLPGVGGVIKQRPEDFRVDEVPLYQASGQGTHIYFRIEKRGVATPVAIARIAKYMNVRPGDIGVAGLKDAQAVSTQTLSLEHADAARIAAYRDPQIRVLDTTLHANKLKTGHLAGNRFAIKIRQVGPADLPAAKAILDILARRGVPNYFGIQRFGARGDTAALGEAMVRGRLDEFVAIFLGRPNPDDPPDCKAARDAFEVDALDRALKRWPRHYADQRKALSAYKKKHRPAQAISAVDRRMRRLFVSAFQSAIFNEVLARRIETIDRLTVGDLAQKTDSGGVFRVEDLDVEQPRAENFKISPTGPIPGYRMELAGGDGGVIEREVLAKYDIDLELFKQAGALKAKGTRRPLRFALAEPGITAGEDSHGEFLELSFGTPSGCYATVVVEEISKNRQPYIRD
ncbi:MAG: tRNA pseudouridine(13) synthase TruD [Phycisphaerae bacterium]|nr:tRNA pseudouridine(13) synthase TruD [Phycisphaerae bacterium]